MGKYIEDGKLDLMGNPIGHGKIGRVAAFLSRGDVKTTVSAAVFQATALYLTQNISSLSDLSLLLATTLPPILAYKWFEKNRSPLLAKKHKEGKHCANTQKQTKKRTEEVEALIREANQIKKAFFVASALPFLIVVGQFVLNPQAATMRDILLASVTLLPLPLVSLHRAMQWRKIEKGDWTIERYVRPTKVKERKLSPALHASL